MRVRPIIVGRLWLEAGYDKIWLEAESTTQDKNAQAGCAYCWQSISSILLKEKSWQSAESKY